MYYKDYWRTHVFCIDIQWICSVVANMLFSLQACNGMYVTDVSHKICICKDNYIYIRTYYTTYRFYTICYMCCAYHTHLVCLHLYHTLMVRIYHIHSLDPAMSKSIVTLYLQWLFGPTTLFFHLAS